MKANWPDKGRIISNIVYFLNKILFPYRLFIYLLCCSTVIHIGCKSAEYVDDGSNMSLIKGIDLLGNQEKITVPFELEQGFIIIKVKLQRTFPMKFIFDTGAENTIIFNKMYSDMLNMPYDQSVPILGSDLGSTMRAHIARNVYMKLGNAPTVKRDVLILEEDYLKLYETLGMVVDGIVGGEFIRGLVMQIDYKDKKMHLYHPDRFIPPSEKNYEILPIKIKNFKPYVESEVISEGDTATLDFLIDTGASLTFLAHTNSHPALHLPEVAVPGRIGVGLGGDLMGFMGLLDHINIGGFSYENVLTSYQNIKSQILTKEDYYRNGLIGNRVMSRFNIFIDYKNSLMYWKPIEDYNKKFDYDKSGLTVFAFGPKFDNFYIKSVADDSPAKKAGIIEGDIIYKFNKKKHTRLTLGKINTELRKKVGNKIKLEIKREEEIIKVEFYLEDLFEKSLNKKRKSLETSSS